MHSDVRHKALLAPPALGDARGEGRRRRGTAVAEPPLGEAVHVGCHERAERVTAAAAHAPERLAPNPPTTTDQSNPLDHQLIYRLTKQMNIALERFRKNKKPTRPTNVYIAFSSDTRAQVMLDLTTSTPVVIAKELGRRWKALTPEKRAPYQTTYALHLEKFKANIAIWNKQRQLIIAHQEKLNLAKGIVKEPIRPPTVYMLYQSKHFKSVKAELSKKNTRSDQVCQMDVIKEISIRWKGASREIRQPFQTKYNDALAKYQEQQNKFTKQNKTGPASSIGVVAVDPGKRKRVKKLKQMANKKNKLQQKQQQQQGGTSSTASTNNSTTVLPTVQVPLKSGFVGQGSKKKSENLNI